jgi:hypothetical protein
MEIYSKRPDLIDEAKSFSLPCAILPVMQTRLTRHHLKEIKEALRRIAEPERQASRSVESGLTIHQGVRR